MSQYDAHFIYIFEEMKLKIAHSFKEEDIFVILGPKMILL